jgi:hypothetical protein
VARLRGKKESGGGGVVQPWGCHGAHGDWLRPAGGVPTAARPRHAGVARRCSYSGALALMRGPRLSVGEGAEMREWCAGARGLAREENRVAEPI